MSLITGGGHVWFPSGHAYQPAGAAPMDYLILSCRGKVVYKTADASMELGVNDLLYISRHDQPVGWRVMGRAEWEVCWIGFEPSASWRTWWRYPASPPPFTRLSLTRQLATAVVGEMEHLMVLRRNARPHHEAFQENALERILFYCLEMVEAPLIDARIERARLFLEQRFRESSTIASLCKVAGISKTRFCQLYKEQCGKSPMRYLEDVRLARAAERLVSREEPVSAVAAWVGFEDALHFSRRFKARYGRSPRAYRQMHRAGRLFPG